MRKIAILALVLLTGVLIPTSSVLAQGMTDDQVLEYVRREASSGTSQQVIASRLLQRGVTMEQIRRIRAQYDSQIQQRGVAAAADAAVQRASSAMRQNGDGTTPQDLTTARRGTTGEVYADAGEDMSEAEHGVQAESGVTEAAGKTVFGRDIFRQRRLSFEPNLSLPTPPDYVLGPGDELVIDVYGESQRTLTASVSAEGTVTLPDYGPISVGGQTVQSAQSRLKQVVGARYESSELRLTLGRARTIMVNVMGEVAVPGTYHLTSFATVFHALYVCGGIGPLGTLRNIQVFRSGRVVSTVDMYDYILHGQERGNIRLHDGDVVKVGTYESLVGISGNVKRPMFYEMKRGEALSVLLEYAGGFTGDAYGESVRLLRQSGESYEVYNVSRASYSSFQLDDGDNVTVEGMLNRYSDVVEVKGAVFRPGQYRLGDGVTTVRTLVASAGGVTEDAFTARAVIHRLQADRSLELVSVDLGGILSGAAPDVALRSEDVLFVPTESDRIHERTLTITGEVQFPGSYEYARGTTVEDLIVEAGGLRDQASLSRVDVSRRIVDPHALEKGRSISRQYTFSIRDGLVVDGTEGFVLEPYDVVHVRRSPAFVSARSITVTGEVNFEGTYTLSEKGPHLTDAIQRAGGLTEFAYLKGATLLRTMNEEERRRTSEVRDVTRHMLDERDSLTERMLNERTRYAVTIDLAAALSHPGSDADIELREGDVIYIPEYNGAVKVSGSVMFPNVQSFESGRSYRWYVRQCGGFGERARRRRSFIVYQNGITRKVGRGTRVEPGCEIVVPAKTHRHRSGERIGTVGWVSIGTSVVTAAALVINATK